MDLVVEATTGAVTDQTDEPLPDLEDVPGRPGHGGVSRPRTPEDTIGCLALHTSLTTEQTIWTRTGPTTSTGATCRCWGARDRSWRSWR
ncbi:hypothetical protein NOCARDAX2BIS_560006 [Nocardioides sp. AX2bis]|nr:hypothetical protein NOCARDAX2BIS_560006 [Nocardioides sp. AX2bis]